MPRQELRAHKVTTTTMAFPNSSGPFLPPSVSATPVVTPSATRPTSPLPATSTTSPQLFTLTSSSDSLPSLAPTTTPTDLHFPSTAAMASSSSFPSSPPKAIANVQGPSPKRGSIPFLLIPQDPTPTSGAGTSAVSWWDPMPGRWGNGNGNESPKANQVHWHKQHQQLALGGEQGQQQEQSTRHFIDQEELERWEREHGRFERGDVRAAEREEEEMRRKNGMVEDASQEGDVEDGEKNETGKRKRDGNEDGDNDRTGTKPQSSSSIDTPRKAVEMLPPAMPRKHTSPRRPQTMQQQYQRPIRPLPPRRVASSHSVATAAAATKLPPPPQQSLMLKNLPRPSHSSRSNVIEYMADLVIKKRLECWSDGREEEGRWREGREMVRMAEWGREVGREEERRRREKGKGREDEDMDIDTDIQVEKALAMTEQDANAVQLTEALKPTSSLPSSANQSTRSTSPPLPDNAASDLRAAASKSAEADGMSNMINAMVESGAKGMMGMMKAVDVRIGNSIVSEQPPSSGFNGGLDGVKARKLLPVEVQKRLELKDLVEGLFGGGTISVEKAMSGNAIASQLGIGSSGQESPQKVFPGASQERPFTIPLALTNLSVISSAATIHQHQHQQSCHPVSYSTEPSTSGTTEQSQFQSNDHGRSGPPHPSGPRSFRSLIDKKFSGTAAGGRRGSEGSTNSEVSASSPLSPTDEKQALPFPHISSASQGQASQAEEVGKKLDPANHAPHMDYRILQSLGMRSRAGEFFAPGIKTEEGSEWCRKHRVWKCGGCEAEKMLKNEEIGRNLKNGVGKMGLKQRIELEKVGRRGPLVEWVGDFIMFAADVLERMRGANSESINKSGAETIGNGKGKGKGKEKEKEDWEKELEIGEDKNLHTEFSSMVHTSDASSMATVSPAPVKKQSSPVLPKLSFYNLLSSLLVATLLEGYLVDGWKGIEPIEIILGVGLGGWDESGWGSVEVDIDVELRQLEMDLETQQQARPSSEKHNADETNTDNPASTTPQVSVSPGKGEKNNSLRLSHREWLERKKRLHRAGKVLFGQMNQGQSEFERMMRDLGHEFLNIPTTTSLADHLWELSVKYPLSDVMSDLKDFLEAGREALGGTRVGGGAGGSSTISTAASTSNPNSISISKFFSPLLSPLDVAPPESTGPHRAWEDGGSDLIGIGMGPGVGKFGEPTRVSRWLSKNKGGRSSSRGMPASSTESMRVTIVE